MSFVSEKPIKAVRKARRCDVCRKIVEVGQPAISWAGTTDGDFQAVIYHPECRAAEIAFNREHQTDFYPGDWMSLRDDMEDEDHLWLLEKQPIVAARMGITEESTRATREAREAYRRKACATLQSSEADNG